MTQYLPPNLLALFAARDPVPYAPPVDKLPHEKKRQPYSGIASYLSLFESPEETPAPVKQETKDERRARIAMEKMDRAKDDCEEEFKKWDPYTNPEATEDAFRTLFVARINYDTSESKLRREFEVYGRIKTIRMVNDLKTGKPRGYAFIEYEHERDMHAAYKHSDGKKIDGRRVLVDVERARTVKGWRPRRLGGGLGGHRRAGPGDAERKAQDPDRPVSRERDFDRERPRRDSREREPPRRRPTPPMDRKRSRSKERKRSRERGDRGERAERGERGERGERDGEDRREKRRRDRDRSDRRSDRRGEDENGGVTIKIEEGERKRERDRGDRGDKDRDRKRSRRSRSRDRDRRNDHAPPTLPNDTEFDPVQVKIKQEPVDEGYDAALKQSQPDHETSPPPQGGEPDQNEDGYGY